MNILDWLIGPSQPKYQKQERPREFFRVESETHFYESGHPFTMQQGVMLLTAKGAPHK